MGNKFKQQISKFSHRGPEEVLVGDLDYVGIPGKVYTPSKVKAGPGLVFVHDWMCGISTYHRTLRHLASWGFVVIAPNTETSALPDHRGLAADVESCLQVLTGVRLGEGNITVAPGKLGIVGHGIGASAAIHAAARRDNVAAVAALYPSDANPDPILAAESVDCPGMVVGTGDIPLFDYGNAAAIAQHWKGDCVYREVEKAGHHTLSEDVARKLITGLGSWRLGTRDRLRGLITGYMLYQLIDEKKLSAFGDPEAETKAIKSYWGDKLEQRADSGDKGRLSLDFLKK